MKKSLQKIEDFYINLGYRSSKLRIALAGDEEYQKLLRRRGQKISKRYKITSLEKRRYILSTTTDFEILSRCRALERKKMKRADREMVRLIKSQLLDEWRKPLKSKLSALEKKYVK